MPCLLQRVAATENVDVTCEFEVWFTGAPNVMRVSRERADSETAFRQVLDALVGCKRG
jgi:hypothetical protein